MNVRGAAGGAAPRKAGRIRVGRRSPTRSCQAVTPHVPPERARCPAWPARSFSARTDRG